MKQDDRHIQAKAIRERILFKRIKQSLNTFCLKFTPYNGKDQHDVTFKQFNVDKMTFTITSAICEIKVRTGAMSYNGYTIQKDKYEYLMRQADKYDNVYYICFFAEGYIIWDLKTIDPSKLQWEEKDFRKNNQHSFTEIKMAADLMTWDAASITHQNFEITETLWKSYQIWDRINKKK
jgi:hypothetical protein